MVEHLNKFSMIVNQLFLVEINFDDEVCVVILLVSLPSSGEPMGAIVSNYIGNLKLKFNYVRDQILVEKVHKKYLGEAATSNFALNVRTKGKSYERTFNKDYGRSNSKNGRSES